MTSTGRRGESAVAQRTLDEALAALIASTRRVRRKLSLVEVAEWLQIARRGLGSLRAVSDRIGISVEMLRQFATVNSLAPELKQLIADRKIESVDIAHRLSKLAPSDQVVVANALVAGKLDSDDVRAVVSLRRAAPRLTIHKVIKSVKGSRNIKEYLALFVVPREAGEARQLRSRLAEVVRGKNIRSFRVEGVMGALAVNSQGRKLLAEAARRAGMTKGKLIDRIVAGRI